MQILVDDLSLSDAEPEKYEIKHTIASQKSNAGSLFNNQKLAIYQATSLPKSICDLIAQYEITISIENMVTLENWFKKSNKEHKNLTLISYLVISSLIVTTALDLSIVSSSILAAQSNLYQFAMVAFLFNFGTAGFLSYREIVPFTNKCDCFFPSYRLDRKLRKKLSFQLQLPSIINSENSLQEILKKNTSKSLKYLYRVRDLTLYSPCFYLLALTSGLFPFILGLIALNVLPGSKAVEISTIASSSISLVLSLCAFDKSRLEFNNFANARTILSEESPDFTLL